MKLFSALLAILLLVGIGLMLATRQGQSLSSGQAGRAFVENDQGELIESDGTRGTSRTVIPDRAVSDGSDEEWLTKFVLTERSGEKVGSQDLAGQPYVAGFFFSTCPSICVRQNSKVQELQKQFQGQGVRFLSISCDPEMDTPEVLTEYAKRFEADPEQWLFMTGKMNYIRRVGSEYFSLGVVRRGHPEKFALMDAAGKMFGLYTWSDDGQWTALQQDIQRLLDAGGVLPDEENSGGEDDSVEADTDTDQIREDT